VRGAVSIVRLRVATTPTSSGLFSGLWSCFGALPQLTIKQHRLFLWRVCPRAQPFEVSIAVHIYLVIHAIRMATLSAGES
jgi:hypothetical protein